jgi:7-carboxy-7-deazaguanine synthase
MNEHIRISEIFGPTIQGEGPLIGRPTVFVRTGGCDYRCTWCDTLYAVLPEHHDEWEFMTPAGIMTRVDQLAGGNPVLVSLSGGNPALQPLAPLIALGRRNGHTFALETQGSVAQPWFAELDWMVLSPKPPSSGMATDWDAFAACLAAARGRPHCVLKIVIFNDADYAYAPPWINPPPVGVEVSCAGSWSSSLSWLSASPRPMRAGVGIATIIVTIPMYTSSHRSVPAQ